jgi:adenosylcobinamide-phosphate synthase
MTFLAGHATPLLLALALEVAVGYPTRVYEAIRHPVVWIGAAIGALDRQLNREDLAPAQRQRRGALALALLLTATGIVAVLLQRLALALPAGTVLLAILAATLLAQRSLYRHVSDVADALEQGGLAAARIAVARIVGRDPEALDAAAVCRAAIESLAENFSDGVVAPAFWFLLGGLPAMAMYKAANTADSMIGHLTPRYQDFGWAAARLDDLVNLPASRLTAALLCGAAWLNGSDAKAAAHAVMRDAGQHRSPNAGWCEAAMAGALGLRLAGPRVYGGMYVDDTWMGDGRVDATAGDIRAALRLYRFACGLLWVLAVVVIGLSEA